MIVRTADGGRRELYARFDSSTPIPRPGVWGATVAHTGERVNLAAAAGLPAFLRGLRLISETAAGLPWMTYRGRGSKRRPVEDAPQLDLFYRPNPDTSPFAFWSYLYMSLPGAGNAYVWKTKVRGRVKALYALDPRCVTPKYEGSSAEFDIRDTPYGPVKMTVGRDRIIHIPGILLEDPYVGVSVVAAHRNGIGIDLGRQRFEGRFIANDTSPSVLLKHGGPGVPTPEQRREVRDSFESRHMGSANAGRTGMVFGGWEVDQMPVNLTDAQFIESKKFGVQDMGRMLGIPSGLLNDPDAPGGDSPEQENMRLLQHGIVPWSNRVEDGFLIDRDLFPEPDWDLEQNEQGFLRADIQTRWDAYRLGRQGGWVTANEIRAREGLPPVPEGDKIQETPVGGAVNSGDAPAGGGEANS